MRPSRSLFEVADDQLDPGVRPVVGVEGDRFALAVGVGSDRGAVAVFRQIRFPGPSPEPDMRLSTHPALRESHSSYAAPIVFVLHGVGMLAAR